MLSSISLAPRKTGCVGEKLPTSQSAEWTNVTLSGEPSAWRVGGPAGPVASRAQLDSVLTSFKWLVIGSTCASVTAATTHYPCGIEVGAPLGAADAGALNLALPWASTTGDLLKRFDASGAPASLTTYSIARPLSDETSGAILPMLSVDKSFIGLYTQDAVEDGTARTLSFRFRVHGCVPPSPDPSTPAGLVILGTTEPAWTAEKRRVRSTAGLPI